MKTLAILLIIAVVGASASWYWAGRAAGPTLDIQSPQEAVGQIGQLELLIDTPDAKLSRLEVVIEQAGAQLPIFRLPEDGSEVLVRQSERQLKLVRPIGKRNLDLQAGAARIVVTAERPVLFGLRHAQSTAVRDIQVRLTPPTIAVTSTFHYINHGGSETVVYRVSPSDVTSGVRVGEYEYAGFPASGAGVEHADPGLRVAFFALLWSQDVNVPIQLYARDSLGNESSAQFDYRAFPKKFRRSRIELNDRFLMKVVPEILRQAPELSVDNPSDLLGSFIKINRDLRKQDNDRIAALAALTTGEMLWHGPFRQLVNTAVEGGFADQRTYLYHGKEVDEQVHLGFDLASTTNAPVVAANAGRVVHAGWLGIYGNCVILDHGMGLQSLYAHLSSIEVGPGDAVEQGDRLGRSGSTGLAAGDHLHFTTLLAGHPVTPVDWWSPKWIQDRIARKFREAGAAAAPADAKTDEASGREGQ